MTRAALYTANMGLANAIARDYWLPGADRDDVHQEARLALWVATGTYKPELGAFKAYARNAIKRDLADAVEAANRHKRRVLTDSDRDTQLALIPDGHTVERTVFARDELRRALTDPAVRQRQQWREAKRRAKARAA